MESLLAAVLQGSSSPLLGLVHTLLLRQAQADMEYSHATGCLQVTTEQGGLDLGASVKFHRVLHYGDSVGLFKPVASLTKPISAGRDSAAAVLAGLTDRVANNGIVAVKPSCGCGVGQLLL
jgi:hypothetical protein